MLEKIANESKRNGIESMLSANSGAKNKLVHLLECIVSNVGPYTEFMLSEIKGYLAHTSNIYQTFVKTEKDKVLFYEELNLFLDERIKNFKRFEQGFRKNNGQSRPIGQTLDALYLLNIGIDLKDKYTYGHMEHVAECANKLGEYFNLPHEKIIILTSAAREHDIGKILTPNYILNKPGKLDEEELKIMNRHAEDGKKILASIIPLSIKNRDEFLDLVGSHHVNCFFLKDEEKNLLKGILSAADAFSAMSSDRPYRKKDRSEIIMGEFKKYSGSQFHPDVVEAITKKGVLDMHVSRN